MCWVDQLAHQQTQLALRHGAGTCGHVPLVAKHPHTRDPCPAAGGQTIPAVGILECLLCAGSLCSCHSELARPGSARPTSCQVHATVKPKVAAGGSLGLLTTLLRQARKVICPLCLSFPGGDLVDLLPGSQNCVKRMDKLLPPISSHIGSHSSVFCKMGEEETSPLPLLAQR